MTTVTDFLGLGVPPLVARAMGVSPVSTTAAGASLASATPIPVPHNAVPYVISTNSGNGLKLPPIGSVPSTGQDGCKLGDQIVVANFLGAAITVYASNSCTITGSGASASGNTGVTVATCNSCIFIPVTTSSWIYIKAGSA